MTDENTAATPLAVGSKAPDFSLPARSGRTVTLSSFAGSYDVLVYFYPKDDTPGCTKEACSLRDGYAELTEAGIAVLGISRDDVASHNAFAMKFNLPFELLTDADGKVHEAYGTSTPFGFRRWSFLVGRDGHIRAIFKNVDVAHHADQVLIAGGMKSAPSTPVADAAAELKAAVAGLVEDARSAVAGAAPAVRRAAKKVVAEIEGKPAVKKAVADVKSVAKRAKCGAKKAIASARRKPAVKQAVRAVKKAVKAVRKAAARPKAVRKAARKPAAKKAVKKAVVKPAKKAVRKAPAKKKAPARRKR